MPIKNDSLNRKLYDLLNARGYDPVPRDSDVSNAGKTMPTISLLLGAANGSSILAFSNKQYAFASIGSGLTDAEVLSLYNSIQAFQTTLSRQV